MTILAGQWFWIIFVILCVFGLFLQWPANPGERSAWRPFGWSVVVLILVGLLGWGVFGPPLK